MPSAAENYVPFQNLLKHAAWVLVMTKCVTMKHKVTVSQKLPSSRWVLPK